MQIGVRHHHRCPTEQLNVYMLGDMGRKEKGSGAIMKPNNDLLVMKRAKELCNYVLIVTEKSPKKYRFTLVSRMQNISLEIIEDIFLANDIYFGDSMTKEVWNLHTQERNKILQKIVTDTRILSYLADISREHQCILPKQQGEIARLTTEVLMLTIKWKKETLSRWKY